MAAAAVLALTAQEVPRAPRTPAPPASSDVKPSDPDAAHLAEARAAAIAVLRRRYIFVSTRALGYFHSADSIEANLNAGGLNLHSDIVVIRARLERVLEQANTAIDAGDFVHALESLDLGEALVAKFAQKLGG